MEDLAFRIQLKMNLDCKVEFYDGFGYTNGRKSHRVLVDPNVVKNMVRLGLCIF